MLVIRFVESEPLSRPVDESLVYLETAGAPAEAPGDDGRRSGACERVDYHSPFRGAGLDEELG